MQCNGRKETPGAASAAGGGRRLMRGISADGRDSDGAGCAASCATPVRCRGGAAVQPVLPVPTVPPGCQLVTYTAHCAWQRLPLVASMAVPSLQGPIQDPRPAAQRCQSGALTQRGISRRAGGGAGGSSHHGDQVTHGRCRLQSVAQHHSHGWRGWRQFVPVAHPRGHHGAYR